MSFNQQAPQEPYNGNTYAPNTAPGQPAYAPGQQPYPPQQPPYAPQKPSHTFRHIGCAVVATLIAVAVIAFGILAFTCPDTHKHKEALSDAINEYVDEQTEQTDAAPFAVLGNLLVKQFTKPIISSLITVDNHVVYSVGYIKVGDEKYKVSFGILGHVYTYSVEEAMKAFEESDKIKSLNLGGSADIDALTDALTDSLDTKEMQESIEKAGKEVSSAMEHAASTINKAAKTADKAADLLNNVSSIIDAASGDE